MPKLLTVPQPSTEYVPHTRDHDTARGFLLYRGPSRLTGAPIIAVATQGRLCENRETGAMHTLWVMREDMSPLAAAYGAGRGADGAVCGDCPLGPGAAPEDVANRLCFVALHQAPLGVWRAFHRGNYPKLSHRAHRRLSSHSWRFCGYGDTAAVPLGVWEHASRYTHGRDMGHTHMWKWEGAREYRTMAMASCQTPQEADHARALGWRAYLIGPEDAEVPQRGAVGGPYMGCAKQREAATRLQCNECGGCGGTRGRDVVAASVYANVHGTPLKGMNPRALFTDRYGADHSAADGHG